MDQLLKYKNTDGLIVLMYHRVNEKLPATELNVPPERFAQQMAWLTAHEEEYEVVELDEAVGYLRGTGDVDSDIVHRTSYIVHRKAKDHACLPADKAKFDVRSTKYAVRTKILLTFDDGYRDNYLHAFPVLREHGLGAVVFLTTNYINTTTKRPRYQHVPWQRDYLDLAEIGEMNAHGIVFGAHTMTHPHLLTLTADEACREIVTSVNVVRELTGRRSVPFCYPYGEYDDKIKAFVRDSGALCAFTVVEGVNGVGCDLYEVRRVGVEGT